MTDEVTQKRTRAPKAEKPEATQETKPETVETKIPEGYVKTDTGAIVWRG